jgi:hypothetical protein
MASEHIKNVFVDGDSGLHNVLAAIVPNTPLGAGACARKVIGAELARIASEQALKPWERIHQFLLDTAPFTERNGLLSSSGKRCRPALRQHYRPKFASELGIRVGQSREVDPGAFHPSVYPVLFSHDPSSPNMSAHTDTHIHTHVHTAPCAQHPLAHFHAQCIHPRTCFMHQPITSTSSSTGRERAFARIHCNLSRRATLCRATDDGAERSRRKHARPLRRVALPPARHVAQPAAQGGTLHQPVRARL